MSRILEVMYTYWIVGFRFSSADECAALTASHVHAKATFMPKHKCRFFVRLWLAFSKMKEGEKAHGGSHEGKRIRV